MVLYNLKKKHMNILMVLTSHSELGNTGDKTGFWVEELAAPYYVLQEAGANITLASPKGGQAPIDPKSTQPDAQTPATKKYFKDEDLKHKVANTKKLSEISAGDFDAVFYPGGHGPMWDLNKDKDSINLIEQFLQNEKPVAAVCHAPAALIHAKNKNGEPIVKGKKVAGFTNSEEEAVKLTDIVPFLLEDELKNKGGNYTKGADWTSHVVRDGFLITGQNPQSSEEAAKELLALLNKTNR